MMTELNTPILFVIFNRPDTTARVFEAIRAVRPKKLFVAADGPRTERDGESERCQVVRAFTEKIDWPCEVQRLYRDENLGCKRAVRGAISWFFDQVEEGIILEDDCLPDPSFFPYCQELLERYRDDERVMMISGDNFQNGKKYGDGSYYFTKYVHIWGWASWRRAWQKYDADMTTYKSFLSQRRAKDIFINEDEADFWLKNFALVAEGMNTWDYQWVYTIMSNHGLAIMPNTNLISNIGFHGEATHTTGSDNPLANMKTSNLGPIVHPTFILPSRAAELHTLYEVFQVQPTVKMYNTPVKVIKKVIKLPRYVLQKIVRKAKAAIR